MWDESVFRRISALALRPTQTLFMTGETQIDTAFGHLRLRTKGSDRAGTNAS